MAQIHGRPFGPPWPELLAQALPKDEPMSATSNHLLVGCRARWFQLFLLACLVACGDDRASSTGPGAPGDITTLQSSKKRLSPAETPATDIRTLARDNATFALDLYQSLRSDAQDNLFYSPYSISLALAMTLAGAEGETASQMTQVLRFSQPAERLHPAFNALDQALMSRGRDLPAGADGTGFELSIANSIWGQQDLNFQDNFLDLLAEQYGAAMRLVDFIGSPDESRQLINEWIAWQTKDRIQDLLPEGSISVLTRLVLTNAIYFKASWLHPFDSDQTQDGIFVALNGATRSVAMMNQAVRTVYTESDEYQAVELPYVGSEISMVLILPATGRFESFEDDLDVGLLEQITTDLHDTRVTLSLPRFEFESTTGLADVLKGLGMQIAFEPPGPNSGADFSGMDGQRDLFVHDVLHKAFVAVDEEGTEAAAATAVIIGVESAPPSAIMVVDHPFIFLIRDRATGAILFLGRVTDLID